LIGKWVKNEDPKTFYSQETHLASRNKNWLRVEGGK
jgi:hypothetical protein